MPKNIKMAVPFSLRQPFKSLAEVKMINNFGSILIHLVPYPTFAEALTTIKTTFAVLKNSLQPFGVLYSTKISVMFPYKMGKMVVDDLSGKLSMVYSNLQAAKKPFVFDGKKLHRHFFVAPGVGKLYTGMGFATCGDCMSMTIFSDEKMMGNPQELAKIIERRNAEILGLETAKN